MRVLLISTYELGRQPVHVASPAAALRRAGHDVRALDLAVEEWDADAVEWAEAVAISVPMHTAMRLGAGAARRIRADRPRVPIAFYGLYAAVSRDHVLAELGDRLLAGEYEPGLIDWVDELASGRQGRADGGDPSGQAVVVHLGRSDFATPDRSILPSLDRYARLEVDGEPRLAGAVEASHGCNQRCRHCPVPAVYDGRTRVVDVDTVMADIAQLVDAGARHITFGDPDFLSGPAHARRVVGELARGFPGLTFDVTTKVEHVLAQRDLWPEMADAGCLFVVSAVECLDDRILALLDKGHTAAQAEEAVTLLREHGIEPHPSFLAFTPWTTARGVLDILEFVARHDLVPVVDPVQYALRLLLPEGSLLLEVPELAPHLRAYDPGAFTWRWQAADPAVDDLQYRLATLVEAGADAEKPNAEVFADVWERVAAAAGEPGREPPEPAHGVRSVPRARITEPWFCCAEPTEGQLRVVSS